MKTKNIQERDQLLEYLNDRGIMARPIWKLMNELPMFENYQKSSLSNAEWLEQRVINIPSSCII